MTHKVLVPRSSAVKLREELFMQDVTAFAEPVTTTPPQFPTSFLLNTICGALEEKGYRPVKDGHAHLMGMYLWYRVRWVDITGATVSETVRYQARLAAMDHATKNGACWSVPRNGKIEYKWLINYRVGISRFYR